MLEMEFHSSMIPLAGVCPRELPSLAFLWKTITDSVFSHLSDLLLSERASSLCTKGSWTDRNFSTCSPGRVHLLAHVSLWTASRSTNTL